MVSPENPVPADVSLLTGAIESGTAHSVGTGRPEAVLREHVQPILAKILKDRGARFQAHDELALFVPSNANASLLDAPLDTRGRADAVYNRFVIEFEPPGSLRPSIIHSATKHAVSQVQQYLRGISEETGLPLERLAGCAFDGSWIVYVAWERGDWRELRPTRVSPASLAALLETLESLASGRGLTAANLYEDFGRESDAARLTVQALFSVFQPGSPSGRTLAMFDQWLLDLGNASGPFSGSDLQEWSSLCRELGLPDSEWAASRILFCLQTYFSLVSKMVALVVLEGSTGADLVDQLFSLGTIEDGFARMESGVLTASTGTRNVIETGVFSWYLHERDITIASGLRKMAELAGEYSAEIVEISPSTARDVLKDLYQKLLPRSIRHRLGEFYTPDWLAQRVINQVSGSSSRLDPSKRLLDPACGSGTFLVEAIGRMIQTANGRDPIRTLSQILENVVGYDLSPLAVQAAKVNYLLALAPLLKFADPDNAISLPIFLADSVALPRKGNVLEGDVYVFESSEGDWRLPASVAQANFLPALGSLINDGIATGGDAEWFEHELPGRIPVVEIRDHATIEELSGLYTKVKDLHDADRNGMWWYMINNAFAPMMQPRFDYVVGNPPWVSWETLPESYRRTNDELWRGYGLRPDVPPERRQASAHVRLDISMLFVARCIDLYLKDRGMLGFVITASVFQSELAGRGFRRRRLGADSSYTFVHIDDMATLSVFDDAQNRTSVLIARRQASMATRVPVLRWLGRETNTIPTSLLLPEVSEMTLRREHYAEPVDPDDSGSPLIIMPRSAMEQTRRIRHKSVYLDTIREGINTRGANGIFFLDARAIDSTLVTVKNRPQDGRLKDLKVTERTIEAGAVRKLLRGEDVSRGAASPSSHVLFFHDEDHISSPLSPQEAEKQFPLAYDFARCFEPFLRSRKTFRAFDPTGDAWLGMYSVTRASLAAHKVVIREIANGMISAAVHGSDVIPDHKLYVIPCETAMEADKLADVLNSRIVDYLVRSFSINTSITGSCLRYLGVKRLVGVDPSLAGLDLLAEALGLTVHEAKALDDIAGAEMR